MRDQNLSTYDNKHSGELYYPPIRWYESGINGSMMEEPAISKLELEKLYHEAREYDFLTGKTPKVLPDYWEEED